MLLFSHNWPQITGTSLGQIRSHPIERLSLIPLYWSAALQASSFARRSLWLRLFSSIVHSLQSLVLRYPFCALILISVFEAAIALVSIPLPTTSSLRHSLTQLLTNFVCAHSLTNLRYPLWLEQPMNIHDPQLRRQRSYDYTISDNFCWRCQVIITDLAKGRLSETRSINRCRARASCSSP